MTDKLYVYLFCSRNKDNKEVKSFKERNYSFVEYETNEEKVWNNFYRFTANGQAGETSRLYKSVNARNESKTRKEFLAKILLEDTPLPKLSNVLASVAEKTENRAGKKWLFDFDEKDFSLLTKFVEDVKRYSETDNVEYYKTLNGYAVVVEHGFDTRELMEKYRDCDVTLKKDAMLFLKAREK